MSGKQVLGYHLLVPVTIVVVLLVVGVPFASALPIGVVAGCASMMFMMMRGMDGHGSHAASGSEADERELR